MNEVARGRTSEIEMVATRVVKNQANVCTVIMGHIQDGFAELVKRVDGLAENVQDLDKNAAKAEDVEAVKDSLNALEKSFVESWTDVKGRLKLFTIAATVAGFIAGIAGLIQLFK